LPKHAPKAVDAPTDLAEADKPAHKKSKKHHKKAGKKPQDAMGEGNENLEKDAKTWFKNDEKESSKEKTPSKSQKV
jgi:hypothetical protein